MNNPGRITRNMATRSMANNPPPAGPGQAGPSQPQTAAPSAHTGQRSVSPAGERNQQQSLIKRQFVQAIKNGNLEKCRKLLPRFEPDVCIEHLRKHASLPQGAYAQALLDDKRFNPETQSELKELLHSILSDKDTSAEVRDVLLKHSKVDVNWENRAGNTPLLAALSSKPDPSKPDPAIVPKLCDLVQALLENGAVLDAKDKNRGNTALHLAAKKGYDQIVEMLLQNGAGAGEKNNDTFTPLVFAAIEGHYEVAKLLCAEPDAQDWINETNKYGDTALHTAVGFGHDQIVELLLQKGAAAGKENNNKLTPLILAALKGHNEVAKLLCAQADAKDWINNPNKRGNTALHAAVGLGHDQIVELLLQKGAAAGKENNDKWTPLMNAARYGNYKALELLCAQPDAQKWINTINSQGETALQIVVQKPNSEYTQWPKVLTLLAVPGVNPNDALPLWKKHRVDQRSDLLDKLREPFIRQAIYREERLLEASRRDGAMRTSTRSSTVASNRERLKNQVVDKLMREWEALSLEGKELRLLEHWADFRQVGPEEPNFTDDAEQRWHEIAVRREKVTLGRTNLLRSQLLAKKEEKEGKSPSSGSVVPKDECAKDAAFYARLALEQFIQGKAPVAGDMQKCAQLLLAKKEDISFTIEGLSWLRSEIEELAEGVGELVKRIDSEHAEERARLLGMTLSHMAGSLRQAQSDGNKMRLGLLEFEVTRVLEQMFQGEEVEQALRENAALLLEKAPEVESFKLKGVELSRQDIQALVDASDEAKGQLQLGDELHQAGGDVEEGGANTLEELPPFVLLGKTLRKEIQAGNECSEITWHKMPIAPEKIRAVREIPEDQPFSTIFHTSISFPEYDSSLRQCREELARFLESETDKDVEALARAVQGKLESIAYTRGRYVNSRTVTEAHIQARRELPEITRVLGNLKLELKLRSVIEPLIEERVVESNEYDSTSEDKRKDENFRCTLKHAPAPIKEALDKARNEPRVDGVCTLQDFARTGLKQAFSQSGLIEDKIVPGARDTHSAIRLACDYIESRQDKDLQHRLRKSFLEQLIDLGYNPQCNTATAQLVLSVPVGIDPAFESRIPGEGEVREVADGQPYPMLLDEFNELLAASPEAPQPKPSKRRKQQAAPENEGLSPQGLREAYGLSEKNVTDWQAAQEATLPYRARRLKIEQRFAPIQSGLASLSAGMRAFTAGSQEDDEDAMDESITTSYWDLKEVIVREREAALDKVQQEGAPYFESEKERRQALMQDKATQRVLDGVPAPENAPDEGYKGLKELEMETRAADVDATLRRRFGWDGSGEASVQALIRRDMARRYKKTAEPK